MDVWLRTRPVPPSQLDLRVPCRLVDSHHYFIFAVSSKTTPLPSGMQREIHSQDFIRHRTSAVLINCSFPKSYCCRVTRRTRFLFSMWHSRSWRKHVARAIKSGQLRLPSKLGNSETLSAGALYSLLSVKSSNPALPIKVLSLKPLVLGQKFSCSDWPSRS